MRSFPSLRDAEIAYGQLEDRLAKLERKTVSDIKSVIRQPVQPADVTIINEGGGEGLDSVLSGDGTSVIHQLIHIFLAGIYSGSVNTPIINFLAGATSGTTANWSLTASGVELTLSYLDPNASPKTFFLRYIANVNEATSKIFYKGVIGDTSNRVESTFLKDLSVTPGGIAPTIGQVLTAADTQGRTTWATPAAGPGSFVQQVNSSSSYAVQTFFTDLPGLSIVIPNPGNYLVTCSLCLVMFVNDTSIHAQMVSNNAGGFFAASGIIKVEKDAAAFVVATPSKTWFLTTVGTNITCKIEIVKNGTGASLSEAGNSTLTIAKVG